MAQPIYPSDYPYLLAGGIPPAPPPSSSGKPPKKPNSSAGPEGAHQDGTALSFAKSWDHFLAGG